MKATIFLLTFLSLVQWVTAQTNFSDKSSVKIWAEVSTSPPAIKLRWVLDPDAANYIVFRKTKTARTWGNALATLPKDSSSFTDRNVKVGETYEYRINRTGGPVAGTGYIFAGIQAEALHWRGSVLLLVDSMINAQLKNDIDTWKKDVSNEGWFVLTFVPTSAMKVTDIKDRIKNFKVSYPDLRAVFILGHVKVPYSGNLAPDGHPDHAGAWPADNYYGDLDGIWTDNSVSNSTATRTENKNEPGDGKFDQSEIPSDLELEIGRVDFSNLPVFPISEVELTRRYLRKNHLFRTGRIVPQRRALVIDNFNFQNEAFGQTGFKNFSPMVGPQHIDWGGYRDSLLKKSYLWSYGAGAGNYEGAAGISNSTNMTRDSLQCIFTFLFGSYFGDWDSRNNFLRSALGSGTILVNAWSGRPLWQVHHMALGETIGYGMRVSINNINVNNTYLPGFGARGVHVALMGDPTLTLYSVGPPSNLEATENGSNITLRWEASPEATHGYNIYKRIEGNSIFELLASNVANLTYTDSCVTRGFTYHYLVRAVKLETTPSGSYYNLSTGVQDTITPILNIKPKAEFVFRTDYEFINLKSVSRNANRFKWIIGRDTFSAVELDVALSCDSLLHTICLIAEGDCESDMLCKNIRIECSVPQISVVKIDHPKCFGELGHINILDVLGADPFTFKWNTGSTDANLLNVPAGRYTVTITSAKSTSKTFSFELVSPDDIEVSYSIKPASPSKNDGGLTNIRITGGTPPYTIIGPPGRRIDSLPAGDYSMTIVDSNGCRKAFAFNVPVDTYSKHVFAGAPIKLMPNPVSGFLTIEPAADITLLEIELFDMMGRSLLKQTYPGKGINFTHRQPGYYRLRCTTNKGLMFFTITKI